MRDIKGFEGEYAISDDGKVWSHKSNRLLTLRGSDFANKIKRQKRKYQTVALWKRGKGYMYFYVHRLVAEAFISNPNSYVVVNHKDGDKSNNWADNLEWCTHEQNMRHAFLNGLTTRGDKNASTILSSREVTEIRKLAKTGLYSQSMLGEMFGVCQGNIHAIVSRKTWNWVY